MTIFYYKGYVEEVEGNRCYVRVIAPESTHYTSFDGIKPGPPALDLSHKRHNPLTQMTSGVATNGLNVWLESSYTGQDHEDEADSYKIVRQAKAGEEGDGSGFQIHY